MRIRRRHRDVEHYWEKSAALGVWVCSGEHGRCEELRDSYGRPTRYPVLTVVRSDMKDPRRLAKAAGGLDSVPITTGPSK